MAGEMKEIKTSFGWVELQNYTAEPTDTITSRRGIAAVGNKLMFFDGADWAEVAGGSGGLVDNSIENKHIKTNAAIAASKLNLVGAIGNAEVADNAAIAASKLNLVGAIGNAEVADNAAIAASKLNLAGAIGNADIADNADIELSKIGGILTEDVAGRSAGVPYTFVVDVVGNTEDATDVNVFNADDNKAPYSMIITDVSALVVNGETDGTITLKDGTDTISDALAVTTTNGIVRTETLDASKISVAKDATGLKLALNNKAFEAKVFITVLLVKEVEA